MLRRRLLTLTLGALGGLAVLIGLGTWQIERLYWKEGLITQRMAAISASPVAPPRTPEAARLLEFHRVAAKGVFLHEREIPVHAIERQSGAAGYLVMTPLRLEDGAVVFVERGWVPADKRAAATRASGDPPGETTVEGLLRLPPGEKPGWFVPANDPGRGDWYWIDLLALARAAGVPDARPFYIEAGSAPNPGGLPVGGQANTDLRNDHLQYAITWYALAAALAVIYLLLLRRERAALPTSHGPP